MKGKRAPTRTRWRQAKASTRLFWRAVIYGIASATFAGVLIGFANDIEADGLLDFDLQVVPFGLIGLIYGVIAAPVIALVMQRIARSYSRGNSTTMGFKLAMKGFTLIGVGVTAPFFAVYLALVDLFSGAPRIPLSASAIILMWLFGVYLSQVLANKYIAEVSPRKRKEKPA